jgi:hypothetical protein
MPPHRPNPNQNHRRGCCSDPTPNLYRQTARGRRLCSGVYFCRTTKGETTMGQMIFIFYFLVLTVCGGLILLNMWGV